MLKRIIFILLVVLLAGCSKSVVEPGCGGYSFGKIYLYMNGGMVDMHELTIAVPPEEGYTDIEVVTGRLLKFDISKEMTRIYRWSFRDLSRRIRKIRG